MVHFKWLSGKVFSKTILYKHEYFLYQSIEYNTLQLANRVNNT